MRLAKPVKIILLGLPLLAVALVVGVVAVLMNTDFNQYKPLIVEATKKATGRDLTIAGDLEVEISLTPAVTVAGVTLSNAGWGERPEMIEIERFEARVSLVPLVFGTIDVQRVVLIGADILLQVDRQGRANFDFRPGGDKQAEAKAQDSGELRIPVVREVVVRDSRLTYADARTGARYNVAIDTLTLNGEGPGDPLNLLYEGSYNEAGVTLAGTLGAPAETLNPGAPWPVDLALEAGGASITVKGTIAEPVKARGLDLAIAVKGAELGELSVLAGGQVPRLGAYSASAKLTGDPALALKLGELKAALAGSDLSGEVTIDLSGKRPLIDARLASGLIDLTALGGGARGGKGEKQAATKLDRVFPDDPLALAGLRALDVKLTFEAGTIVAAGARLQNANIGLLLSGGNLVVKPLKAVVAGGVLDGSLRLDGRKKAAGLAAKITLSGVNLGQLLKDMGATDVLEGSGNFRLDVAGSGGSVARIMAGLNGEVALVMGKGRIKSGSLQTLIGGPTQVLGKLFTGGDSDYTSIECAVIRFPIRKGVATAEPLVLDTDVAVFLGKGSVNLGAEVLNLTIKPKVKKTTISAAVPVRIQGTLANPKYKLDELGVARKVGGLLGIVLFPPAAILGLGELGATADNPCVKQAKSGDAKKARQTSASPTGVLKGAGESITKGLKSLFGD